MPKDNVQIVIYGGIHRDPAYYNVLQQYVKKLHKDSHKIIVCDDEPRDMTLDRMEHKLIQVVSYYDTMKMKSHVSSFLSSSPDLRLPYMTLKNQYDMINSLTEYGVDQAFAAQSVNEVSVAESYRNAITFSRFLKDNKIPYHGLNRAADEMHKVRYEDASREASEHKMMEGMAHHMITHAKELEAQGGGTLIATVGMLYAERLAAYLKKHLAGEGDTPITLSPMIVHSPYVDDQYPPTKKMLSKMKEAIPSDVKPYANEAAKDYYVQEEPATGCFVSPELGSYLDDCSV